ncbi:hypothetical protein BGX34_002270 [Mortierella sp. NVP85]|nr:hypothetical protein BGX34_002270 [Mortierella sp. NVP85]
MDDTGVHHLSPSSVAPIADVINKSPYAKVLRTRSYKELSRKKIERLNLNWTRHPEAPLVASRMLSGGILYNVKTGEAILMNEVETYGRGRMIDCHQEQTGVVKQVPIRTSMTSTTGKDYYDDIRPVTTHAKDGQRLEIGTKTCDVLVTSCIRLDSTSTAPISLGGNTLNFIILESNVQDIRIFLDSKQAEAAKMMIGKSVSELIKNMGLESMRQLRTKFDQLDTYDLFRCSGPLTATCLHRPST